MNDIIPLTYKTIPASSHSLDVLSGGDHKIGDRTADAFTAMVGASRPCCSGSPTNAIESAVKQVGPQLLVIGATHRPILKRLLGASVAHEVLRAIDCDVLIASMSRARLSREGLARLALPDTSAAQWPTYW